MFRTLRAQHGLTQAELAHSTGLSPGYILKAEDLTFPIPSPVLLDFYLKQDETLDIDYLKSWYAQDQLYQRQAWLSQWTPALNPGSFRRSWVDAEVPDELIHPTEYALSKGLCLPASVVYSIERGARPHTLKVVLNQLIDYVESGLFEGSINYDQNTSQTVLSGLLVLKEHFVD